MNRICLFTNQLSEKPLIQLNILKAENVLVWWRASDGPQLGITSPIMRQTNDKDTYVVVFGICGSSDGTRAAWMIHSIGHPQSNTHTPARSLLNKELCGVRDGVGQICSVTNVAHGQHTASEDIYILPVAEVVFHQNSAAVLQHGQT